MLSKRNGCSGKRRGNGNDLAAYPDTDALGHSRGDSHTSERTRTRAERNHVDTGRRHRGLLEQVIEHSQQHLIVHALDVACILERARLADQRDRAERSRSFQSQYRCHPNIVSDLST